MLVHPYKFNLDTKKYKGNKMKLLFMLLILLSSITSFASEKCTLKGYATVFLENGSIFNDVRITDVGKITRERTWQDCYKQAITLAKEYPATISLTISGRRVQGGSADTSGYIFISWAFDDMWFDTTGKVTKYTDENESYPLDEDLRYKSNGTLFK